MLIPAELYIVVGSARMELYRLFLLLLSVVILPRILQRHRLSLAEKALLFYCFWCFLGFLKHNGLSGIQPGVVIFVEVFVGYFVGMSVAGNIRNLKSLLSVILFSLIILIPFAIAESQTGYRMFHVLAANIAGTPVMEYLGDSYLRHGLHRASTVFSHPILYSVSVVLFLPVSFVLYPKAKAVLMNIGVYVAMITSVTSASFIMAIMQMGLFVLKWLSKYIPAVFKMTAYVAVFAYVVLSFASNRGPILLLIQSLSLNSWTAYTRYLQWQYAADDIARNPIFGIGFSEWTRPFWMPPSVDSFWLMTVLQNGYLAVLALGVFFILSLKSYWLAWKETKNALYFSFFCSIFSVVFAAFTVDFFDRAQLMVFLVVGVYNSFLLKKTAQVKS